MRVVGLALDAAVPGAAVVRAVTVGLAVRTVVLECRDDVTQGETIMSTDEVNARRCCAAIAVEDVWGSGQALSEFALHRE